MKKKGFFDFICGFFSKLCCPQAKTESADSIAGNEPDKPSADAGADALTGVERYIRNQADNNMTGVSRYIQRQSSQSDTLTGVEEYIQRQTNARQLTGVEKYIRDK